MYTRAGIGISKARGYTAFLFSFHFLKVILKTTKGVINIQQVYKKRALNIFIIFILLFAFSVARCTRVFVASV